MKRTMVVVAVLFLVLGTMALAQQMRLGIVTQNTYSGVSILNVIPGYPAYGNLQVGDVVVAAHVFPNTSPQPIAMGYGDMRICAVGPGNQQTNLQSYSWYNSRIYSAAHLQSVIFGAPYHSTLVIWVWRWGTMYQFVIQLLDSGGPGQIFMNSVP
ncbi:MAG TPA: hypothetical protein P5560_05510 [Thermotogota bacterium]|nr:hypothetical protein [Thermotogota bacterium]HRW92396.1 hypothetical protein [Thermotogota bacterium]